MNRRCKINKIMQRKDLTKAIREASINDKGQLYEKRKSRKKKTLCLYVKMQ